MLRTHAFGPVTRIIAARRMLGMPMRSVSMYLVNGLLIDSGPPAVAPELVDWLRTQKVSLVFNTHHHEDHAGGDRRLTRELGLRILAGPRATSLIGHLPKVQLYRRAVWGTPETATIEPSTSTILAGGLSFEQVPSPGHCPDHVCLFERQNGWLFSGDLFIHERVRHLRPDEDLWLEVQSLKKALALAPRVMFCAHAGVLTEPVTAIRRKLAYWADVGAEARSLSAKGMKASQISRRVLGAEGLMTIVTGRHFSKTALVTALLALPAGALEFPRD
jgi:glyoxylase-like metal-dependent hydrolase (beta-lactamase superfamily II)